MKIKNTLPISEARKNIFSIAKEVQHPSTYYTLTEKGRPRVVILSAEKFESLIQENENRFLLHDKKSYNHSDRRPHIFPRILVVRDSSKIVYLSEDDHDLKYREEGLIKAQLYVDLIEKYHYPVNSVELGRYVKVGGEKSKRYIEADVMIDDRHGNVESIFEVSSFVDFEDGKDKIVADLFDLAYASTWAKKPKYLVYYSRSYKNCCCQEKILVIDYTKFNSFLSWKKAGRPGSDKIPEFKKGESFLKKSV